MSDLPWPSYDHRFKWIFLFFYFLFFLEIEGQSADECIKPKNNAPTWRGGRGAQAYHTTMSHVTCIIPSQARHHRRAWDPGCGSISPFWDFQNMDYWSTMRLHWQGGLLLLIMCFCPPFGILLPFLFSWEGGYAQIIMKIKGLIRTNL